MSKQKWHNVEGRINLAGTAYSDYQLVCGTLKPGTTVQLIGEPHNKYDSMAIRVEYKGISLGYIPAKTVVQSELWNYHKRGAKIVGVVTAFNKTNPTWSMITIQCMRTEVPTVKCKSLDVVF